MGGYYQNNDDQWLKRIGEGQISVLTELIGFARTETHQAGDEECMR
jgi:hypothetical protein